ncbi:MAG: V-type ATP synthase subunit D [Candidatus Thermoplasmatota archaeon]|nr:V-type ATP synthase subunit D [Candidatus Thermoplasmatota archaeon]MCL5790152.1 V-type ATP synthase subunit D [Candidatus Thermoplasmatota archaeon]
METTNIRPTRMELLKTKGRIKLAKRGLDLLKLKRSSLIMEFFSISREVKGLRGNVSELIEKSITSERLAEIVAGKLIIENTAFFQPGLQVQVNSKNVMGVKIPQVQMEKQKSFMDQLYEMISLPTSLMETRENFAELLDRLLIIAEKEIAMRRLLIEIDRTKRRTNSIENVLIPRLTETATYIKMKLDEIDRETFITLKVIKGKIEERGEESV